LGRQYVAGTPTNHVVKIWNTADTVTPVVSATILGASTSDANGFKWVDITPYTLLAGQTYRIALDEAPCDDAWNNAWTANQYLHPTLTLGGACYGSSGAYPSTYSAGFQIYSTPALWLEDHILPSNGDMYLPGTAYINNLNVTKPPTLPGLNVPASVVWDIAYPSTSSVRIFNVSGAAFQFFGGDVATYGGQGYIDFGSQTQDLASRGLYIRNKSLAGGVVSAWTFDANNRFVSGTDGTAAYAILTAGTIGGGAITGTSFVIGANTLTSFANLSSVAGLSYASASFVKMTGANTFTLDTATYVKVGTATPATFTPANPTGVTGTTYKMQGLGAVATPLVLTTSANSSGKIRFTIDGLCPTTAVAGGNASILLCYGTGAAPTNGDAATGTTVGVALTTVSATENITFPWCKDVVITGLSASTAYWFDVQLKSGGAATTATITALEATLQELPF
jgi:hypothetical protein